MYLANGPINKHSFSLATDKEHWFHLLPSLKTTDRILCGTDKWTVSWKNVWIKIIIVKQKHSPIKRKLKIEVRRCESKAYYNITRLPLLNHVTVLVKWGSARWNKLPKLTRLKYQARSPCILKTVLFYHISVYKGRILIFYVKQTNKQKPDQNTAAPIYRTKLN